MKKIIILSLSLIVIFSGSISATGMNNMGMNNMNSSMGMYGGGTGGLKPALDNIRNFVVSLGVMTPNGGPGNVNFFKKDNLNNQYNNNFNNNQFENNLSQHSFELNNRLSRNFGFSSKQMENVFENSSIDFTETKPIKYEGNSNLDVKSIFTVFEDFRTGIEGKNLFNNME